MESLKRNKDFDLPVRAVQFGTGNFLRAFIDWMTEEMNRETGFHTGISIIQSMSSGTGDALNAQDGLYHVCLRGLENGESVEVFQQIHCVKNCLNAQNDWKEIQELFASEELRFCFSNTTEAGIEYRKEAYSPDSAPQTFPAKLASLLHHRFGSGRKGLIILPCELIEENGTALKNAIRRYASDWGFSPDFMNWLDTECIFCNTLVDRIVSGYPKAEAELFREKLGLEDKLLDCAEPFHFFAIEAPESVKEELPFGKAGLNVKFTTDITPYRTRKVRFLNGGHTASVLAAYLAGFDEVDQMVNDEQFGRYLRKLLFDEIYITLNLPDEEKTQFAEAVLERFANPFAHHRLLSISLNSVSKWKVRVLPSLLDYVKIKGVLPEVMTFSFAALLAFYCGQGREHTVSDSPEIVEFFETLRQKNDPADLVSEVMAREDFWGMNLNDIPGFHESVTAYLTGIQRNGIRAAVERCLA